MSFYSPTDAIGQNYLRRILIGYYLKRQVTNGVVAGAEHTGDNVTAQAAVTERQINIHTRTHAITGCYTLCAFANVKIITVSNSTELKILY